MALTTASVSASRARAHSWTRGCLGPNPFWPARFSMYWLNWNANPHRSTRAMSGSARNPAVYTAGMASIFSTRARRRSAASSVSALIRSAVSSIRPATRSTRSLTRARRTAALTLTLPDCSMTSVCRAAVFGAHADPITAPTMTAPIHCHRMLKAQGVFIQLFSLVRPMLHDSGPAG